MKRLPLFISFILFIALCVSLAYWTLQLFKPPLRPIAPTPPPSAPVINLEAAANLFGGQPQASEAVASNIELKGIIAAGRAGDSVAILAANGKPAQAIGIGRELLPGLKVKEIHGDYVLLSEGGAVKRVELPEKPKESNTSPPNRAVTAPPAAATAPNLYARPATPAQGGSQSAPSQAQGLPPAPPTPTETPANTYGRPATPAQSGGTQATAPAQTQGLPPAVPAPGTAPPNRQIVPAIR
jgi:general secretion pathway protein C